MAKQVFQVHGADDAGRCLLRKQLKRSEVLRFFAGLKSCLVAMEACGSAHFWAREVARLGPEPRLVPPAYVKPYVKRGKTDRIDAEAICEAASRPAMRFAPVKTIEQQSLAALVRCGGRAGSDAHAVLPPHAHLARQAAIPRLRSGCRQNQKCTADKTKRPSLCSWKSQGQ